MIWDLGCKTFRYIESPLLSDAFCMILVDPDDLNSVFSSGYTLESPSELKKRKKKMKTNKQGLTCLGLTPDQLGQNLQGWNLYIACLFFF